MFQQQEEVLKIIDHFCCFLFNVKTTSAAHLHFTFLQIKCLKLSFFIYFTKFNRLLTEKCVCVCVMPTVWWSAAAETNKTWNKTKESCRLCLHTHTFLINDQYSSGRSKDFWSAHPLLHFTYTFLLHYMYLVSLVTSYFTDYMLQYEVDRFNINTRRLVMDRKVICN